MEAYEDENIGMGTKLRMVMDVKPYKFFAKIVTPFITGIVTKAVQNDMDTIRTYCDE